MKIPWVGSLEFGNRLVKVKIRNQSSFAGLDLCRRAAEEKILPQVFPFPSHNSSPLFLKLTGFGNALRIIDLGVVAGSMAGPFGNPLALPKVPCFPLGANKPSRLCEFHRPGIKIDQR